MHISSKLIISPTCSKKFAQIQNFTLNATILLLFQSLSEFTGNAVSLDESSESVTVPKGCSLLNENMIWCENCTGARSFMKTKSVKFDIPLNAVFYGSMRVYIINVLIDQEIRQICQLIRSYCKVFET
jgi:hypothetical protein